MISVIIPTYNRASFLGRAVSSVLAQSYSHIELIIVDDGSGDETKKVVRSFKDKRISYFYQENKGVSAARNFGISKARGEHIALLDSDDYWFPDKLKLQLEFMRQGGFRISQTGEVWLRNGKRVNPGHKHQKPSGWIFEKSLELCLVSPSCVVMEKKLAGLGFIFNENFPACEDYDLWLRISLEYPVGLLPQDLTVKTGGHADQLSGRIIGLDLFRIYSLLDLEKNICLSPDKKKALRRVLLRKAGIYFRGCLKRGRHEEAQRVQELLKGRIAAGQSPREGTVKPFRVC
jgi:glycosyltransferase involved in cell wall biosynthesis